MPDLRFALFGAGWFARFQLGAWCELKGVKCAAIYNRTLDKARKLADEFGVPNVYDDPEELLKNEKLDFIDLVTHQSTLSGFVFMAARHRMPVICQKPMALSVAVAKEMVAACKKARVPLFVHENWRWQAPIRKLKEVLDSGAIGRVFYGRVSRMVGYPVFVNEPALKEMKRFVIADMGIHLLDVSRFLFGEADTVYCRTHRVHPDIKGEDVAFVMLKMKKTAETVLIEVGFPETPREREVYPETLIFVEGDRGTAEVTRDFGVRFTTNKGTVAGRYPPKKYPWSDPRRHLVSSSIVSCNEQFLKAFQGKGRAETTGEDNLKTIMLTYAAYESAATGKAVKIK
jgi:D-apiose dehydrogenase